MTEYVVGFMFNTDRTRVALILKNRPRWQAGWLNGIGGKIETGESPIDAIVREFREETGHTHTDWTQFLVLKFPGGQVHFFKAFADCHAALATMTDEPVEIHDSGSLPSNVIFNLRWMIPLALDQDVSGLVEVRSGEDEDAAAA